MTTVIHYRDRGSLSPTTRVVHIDRGTIWGNPHPSGRTCPVCRVWHTRDQAIAAFQADWYSSSWQAKRDRALHDLKDAVLICWCSPKPCHGGIIAAFVNRHFYPDALA